MRAGGGKSEHHRARCRVTRSRRRKEADFRIHAGGDAARRPDGQCHRKYTARISQERRVRVKRCGKSAPLEAQATRHGKPHRVQGQIGDLGAARSRSRASETGPGYWLHRQMILSARKSADRIRLTALPKPPPSWDGSPPGGRIIFATPASRRCSHFRSDPPRTKPGPRAGRHRECASAGYPAGVASSTRRRA